MGFEPEYKKPGDLIKSDEWNKILDELISLRKLIESMTRSATLTSLASPIGTPYNLSTGMPDDFNYGTDVMGLITKQYHVVGKEAGKICRFGIHDFADVVYYWAGVSKGERDSLKITLEYVDGTTFESGKLLIHECSKLKPKGSNNPYVEYLHSPNQRVWYKYGLENPNPDKGIRYITFEDVSAGAAVRIANVLHYVARVKPLTVEAKKEQVINDQ
jgi:hypothetical protein